MARFTNQAQLTYNSGVTNSNVAVGEIVEVLEATKTAVTSDYERGESITYIVSIVNSGDSAFNGLTVTDDLGAYTADTAGTVYPLTYVDGSVKYYVNGAIQAPPSATSAGTTLSITGINVPANGNALLVYEATVNNFAPLAEDSTIVNTATVTGTGITTPITATETITASDDPQLTITKSISPVPVSENGQLTYTFVIQNYGNTEADASDAIILTDTFDPALDNISVTFNGNPWTASSEYTYTPGNGEFATTSGAITVPEATYTQDTGTGSWTVNPGSATLVVTGTVS